MEGADVVLPVEPLEVRAARPRRSNGQVQKRRALNLSSKTHPAKRHHGCGSCSKRKVRRVGLDGHGPGSQLIRIMSEAGVPHCQACVELAAKMDAWGPQGCAERLDEIVGDILPRAREWLSAERPWAHRLLSVVGAEDAALRLAIRGKVGQAIKASG